MYYQQRINSLFISGAVFLSGGQTEVEATLNLNAINQYTGPKPWALSFCFGRALQASVIKCWNGDDKNIEAAQKVFIARAKVCFRTISPVSSLISVPLS